MKEQCIMNYFILLSIPTGGFSGGLLYFMWEDIYDIQIKRTRFNTRALNSWKQLLNRGFVAGALTGSLYAYLGMPIVNYIMEKL